MLVPVKERKTVSPSPEIADLVYERIFAAGVEIVPRSVHAVDLSLFLDKTSSDFPDGKDFVIYVDKVRANFYRFLYEKYGRNFLAFMQVDTRSQVSLSGLVVPLDKSSGLSFGTLFSKESLGRIESELLRLMREQGFSSAKRKHDPDFRDIQALRQARYHETPYPGRLQPPSELLQSRAEIDAWAGRERERLHKAYKVAADQGRMGSLLKQQIPEEQRPNCKRIVIPGRHPGVLPDVLKDLGNTEVLEIAIKRVLVNEGILPEVPLSDEIVCILIDGVMGMLVA